MTLTALFRCCHPSDVKADLTVERADEESAVVAPARVFCEESCEATTGAPAIDEKAQVKAEGCGDDAAEEVNADSASTGSGVDEPTSATTAPETEAAEALTTPPPLPRPDFTGTWLLAELEGDFEEWLQEMKQPLYIRAAARALRYGVGKVKVRCEQSGDDFFFAKTLCDPRRFRDVTARFTVGDGMVHFFDDIGAVTAQTSKWEGAHLVLDAIADDTKLPLQLRIYFDERGNFVEEMVSCGGKSIVYTFKAKSR